MVKAILLKRVVLQRPSLPTHYTVLNKIGNIGDNFNYLVFFYFSATSVFFINATILCLDLIIPFTYPLYSIFFFGEWVLIRYS